MLLHYVTLPVLRRVERVTDRRKYRGLVGRSLLDRVYREIKEINELKEKSLTSLNSLNSLTSLYCVAKANAAIKPRAETACRLCRGGAVKGRQRRANG